MNAESPSPTKPDFELAQRYLDIAKTAHEEGDVSAYRAACYLIAVALKLDPTAALRCEF